MENGRDSQIKIALNHALPKSKETRQECTTGIQNFVCGSTSLKRHRYFDEKFFAHQGKAKPLTLTMERTWNLRLMQIRSGHIELETAPQSFQRLQSSRPKAGHAQTTRRIGV